MASFSVPDWSAPPPRPVTLEVLETGVIERVLDLSQKPTYSLGRSPDFCDFAFDEPLMSRRHAVIQHRADGALFVFDLGSTHGTFLNKRRVPAGEFVQLRAGDFLRFGPRENRFFIVQVEREEQPDLDVETQQAAEPKETFNAEKAALEAYLQKKKNKSHRELYEELLEQTRTPEQKKKLTRRPKYDRSEVTWGMLDEDIVYGDHVEEEIIRTDLLRMLPNLTPKHLSNIEAFEKLQRKMHMLTVTSSDSGRLQ